MKTYKVLIAAEAEADLDAIYGFIAKESVANARKFVRELRKKILDLKRFPFRGQSLTFASSPTADIRYLHHRGYNFVYEVNGGCVTLLMVVGPGEDWIEGL